MKESKQRREAKFDAIFEAAREAGLAAGNEVECAPMNLVNYATGKTYCIPDGPCGFAWIVVKGNSSFGRWATKQTEKTESGYVRELWSKHYPSGLCHYVWEFNQSVTRKKAYARACAAVLNEYGIDAYAGSRLD